MSALLLTVNLTTGAVTLGDGPWTPRTFTWGESLTLAFQIQEVSGGQLIEPVLDVRKTTAALGFIDVPPQGGKWALQIGDGASTVANTTALLQYNASNKDLQTAINALPDVVTAYGAATVLQVAGSYLIVFATAIAAVPMKVRNNTLVPASFGQYTASTVNGVWQHRVRLVESPLAFTSVAERVLPDAPVTAIVLDAATAGGEPSAEIQSLFVPPAFRGSYYLEAGTGERTVALSRDDTFDVIQAALETVFGKGNIAVTLVDNFLFHIAFIGTLLDGVHIAQLTPVPVDPPPGYLTLTLPFDRAPLLERLRGLPASANGMLSAPLEICIFVGGAQEKKRLVLANLSVLRPLVWPDMETVPDIDWTNPTSPVDYKPFSRSTVLVAQPGVPIVLGDGEALVFPATHGLATEMLFEQVRENVSGGRILVRGTDYTARVTSADVLTITSLVGAPADEGWVLEVVSLQAVAYFANGLTVATSQIYQQQGDVQVALDDLLAALGVRIAALEALAPTTPLGLGVTAAGGSNVTFTIDDVEVAYPGSLIKTTAGKVDRTTLPSPAGYLLPAIHVLDGDRVSYAGGALPDAVANAGKLWVNNSGAALLLRGGGWRKESVPVGGFFGSDGHRLYALVRGGDTSTSYFPIAAEFVLWERPINAQQLRAASTASLRFAFSAELLNATCEAKARLVLEWAPVNSQSTPATTTDNLASVAPWSALLSQPITLSSGKETATYGADIIRAANGTTFNANKLVYGLLSAAATVPTTADMAVRLVWGRWFDTVNNVPLERGTVIVSSSAFQLTIS